MTDAYLPPRQDADEPPAPAPATWTIRSVLRGMLATARRQPLMMFLTVFAIPLLWSVPAQWMQESIVPKMQRTWDLTSHCFGSSCLG
jgi:hypothetical protein